MLRPLPETFGMAIVSYRVGLKYSGWSTDEHDEDKVSVGVILDFTSFDELIKTNKHDRPDQRHSP